MRHSSRAEYRLLAGTRPAQVFSIAFYGKKPNEHFGQPNMFRKPLCLWFFPRSFNTKPTALYHTMGKQIEAEIYSAPSSKSSGP